MVWLPWILCAALAAGTAVLFVLHLRSSSGREEQPAGCAVDELSLNRQKLQAVGELSRGIVHDLNNTLATIIGYGELIERTAEEGSPARRYASTLVRSAGAAADLLRQVRAFAKGEDDVQEPFDVHRTIDELHGLLGRIVPRNVLLEKRLEAERSVVLANATGLFQALLNLAVNAVEAMPGGGHILLRTRSSLLPGAEEGSGDRAVDIRVEDTGPGIDPALGARVFDPDFTTKPHGTGTGLAVVARVAREAGGRVHFTGREGGGTVFVLTLPLSHQAEAMASTSSGPVLAGRGRVLLVDDEPDVLAAMAESLASLGYEPLPYADPGEAEAFYRASHPDVDVVLVDLDMPVPGSELLRRLRDVRPDLKAFYITGLALDRHDPVLIEKDVLGILQKPLKMANLSQMLHWALH